MKGTRTWSRWRVLRWALLSILALGMLFALLNAGIALLYWNRALPNSYLGRVAVGGQSFDKLRMLPASAVAPSSVTFTKGSAHVSQTLQQVGIAPDLGASVRALQATRTWLPVRNLFGKHYVPLQFRVNEQTFAQAVAAISPTFYLAPTAQHIAWSGSDFVIAPATSGFELDSPALKPLLLSGLRLGQATTPVPTKTLAPLHTADDAGLPEQVKHLQQLAGAKIGFAYGQQTVQPTKNDIGGWFSASGQAMALSTDKVNGYIAGLAHNFGISAANQNDLVTATSYAMSKGQALTFAVVPTGTVVRTYCTAVLGESDANLNDLIGKLAATYADTRGWSDGGRIAFQHVSSGCQYTVWLSAASKMTSFGSICDDYYNCQVGTNVVLNYDRWTSATTPWNATGGSLENYRTLMIDHETGHRLGFLDNPTCPGAGQAAPVMMQQSIDLKGCVFNVWPLASELAQLNAALGI